MNNDLPAMEAVLRRLNEDLANGPAAARYDAAADILVVVVYRPDDAITVHDGESGVYIDFDPDQRRISGLTVIHYRKKFLPAQAERGQFGWGIRVAFAGLAVCDKGARWLGIGLDRYWRGLVTGRGPSAILSNYGRQLGVRPGKLAELSHRLVPA